jgi:cytochrome c556
MQKKVVAMALAAIIAGAATTADVVASDFAGAREHTMKEIGKSMRKLGDIVKGNTAYNADDVKAALGVVARNAAEFPKYFPAGSENDSDAALPAIWQNFDDFKAKAANVSDSADAAIKVADSLDSFKPAFGKLAAGCKSCHDSYRAAD